MSLPPLYEPLAIVGRHLLRTRGGEALGATSKRFSFQSNTFIDFSTLVIPVER